METVLKWLGQYSAPIALLLALSAALIYLLQNVVEKTIAFQFDRYAKEISLKLEKRSNFEERILLDRYMVLRDLQTRLGRVMTDLNRVRHGMMVEGLFRNGDIVPLTEIFSQLAVDRYLITERFHKILWEESQLIIAIANETDPERLEVLQAAYLRSLDAFYEAMNDVFGIDKITWETR